MPSGILIIPTEITLESSNIIANPVEHSQGEPAIYFDQFDVDFVDHYGSPIIDQADPMNRVPFLIRGKSEFIKNVRYLDVSKNLDMVPHRMRTELYKNLYIGLDIPKESIEGKGSVNHWTGASIDSELISNHVIPLGELIADLITECYFRPVLIQRGMSPRNAEKYSITFDPSEILPRQDKSTIACKLFEFEVLSEAALLECSGFKKSDAPDANERRQRLIFKLILSSPVTLAPLLMPKLDGLEDVAEELERIRALAEEEGGSASVSANKRSAEVAGDDLRGRTRSSGGRSSSLIPTAQSDDATRARSADLPPSPQRSQDSDPTISDDFSTKVDKSRTKDDITLELEEYINSNLEELKTISPLLSGKTVEEIAGLITGTGVMAGHKPNLATFEVIQPMKVVTSEESIEPSEDFAETMADNQTQFVSDNYPADIVKSLSESLALVRSQTLALAEVRTREALSLKRAELGDSNFLAKATAEGSDTLSQIDEDDLALLGLDWEMILDSSPRDNLAEALVMILLPWMTYDMEDPDSENKAPLLAALIASDSTDYIIATKDIATMSEANALEAAELIVQNRTVEYLENFSKVA